MKIETDIEIEGTNKFDIIDTQSYKNIIYLITSDNQLGVLRSNNKEINWNNVQIENKIPTCISADENYVYIGYTDGSFSVWYHFPDVAYIKRSSINDASGHGKKEVKSIHPTSTYLFVNTLENGVLIYIKPSLLFHKWIMIEGETSIQDLVFDRSRLHVLTDDYEVHKLDFQRQLLIDCPTQPFDYIDIQVWDPYLVLLLKNAIHIYHIETNYKLINRIILKKQHFIGCYINNQTLFIFNESGNLFSLSLEEIGTISELNDLNEKFPIQLLHQIKKNFKITPDMASHLIIPYLKDSRIHLTSLAAII